MQNFDLQRVRATVYTAEVKSRLVAHLLGGAVDEQAQLVFSPQLRLYFDDHFDVTTRIIPHSWIVLGPCDP